MLLKIAALLAAVSHTYHDTLHELATDKAAEVGGRADHLLKQAARDHQRRVSTILAGASSRDKMCREALQRALVAEVNRDKAQSIIDVVRGEA
jgi:hypothetical protein